MAGPTHRLAAVITILAGALLLTGCASSTARLTFRPRSGLHLRYRVEVRSTAVTALDGQKAQRSTEATSFVLDQQVIAASPQGATVAVELQPDSGPPQRFTARLDAAGQLAGVDRIEGLPAGLLGRLGIAEIFPSATLGPPARVLAAGARWSLRQPVLLSDQGQVTLTGRGSVRALSFERGRRVARVEETFTLPAHRTIDDLSGSISLDGTETTVSTMSRSADDGTVVSARARTVSRFAIAVVPPTSGAAPARSRASGTMVVEVRSTTRRLS